MDKTEAKRVLALFRPGVPVEADPMMAEAIEWTKRDSELARWFEQHCVLQKRIQSELRAVSVPSDLKSQILSARERTLVNAWWRHPAFLSAAAAVVLMFGLATYWWQPNEEGTLASFRRRMVRAAVREYRMELVSNDLKEIRAFLARKRGPSDYELTPGLEKLARSGCGVLPWCGQPVSMICFDLGSSAPEKERTLWLFVIEKSSLPDPPGGQTPQFVRASKLMTGAWTKGDKTYLMIGWGDRAALERFF